MECYPRSAEYVINWLLENTATFVITADQRIYALVRMDEGLSQMAWTWADGLLCNLPGLTA